MLDSLYVVTISVPATVSFPEGMESAQVCAAISGGSAGSNTAITKAINATLATGESLSGERK